MKFLEAGENAWKRKRIGKINCIQSCNIILNLDKPEPKTISPQRRKDTKKKLIFFNFFAEKILRVLRAFVVKIKFAEG
jgi:hypothetical protein